MCRFAPFEPGTGMEGLLQRLARRHCDRRGPPGGGRRKAARGCEPLAADGDTGFLNVGGTMGDMKVNLQGKKDEQDVKGEQMRVGERLDWETPKMEDVSEQVMAQPYIRFT